MRKRVLVTGAAGFIGSHVAQSCLSLGMDVVATDDLSGGFIENIPQGVVWVQGDLTDNDFVQSLWINGGYDYVYHLAAYAAEGLSHFIRRYNYRINLMSSINLINRAIIGGSSCFVFTSSIAVYGGNAVPMTEHMVPMPEDPYGISKYAIECDLRAAAKMFGMDYIIFRPHNVYGERQNIADKYRNVIGIFMNQALSGKPMTIFGDGLQTRAFTYINDIAPIIAMSPEVSKARNCVYNIGSDKPHTVLEVAAEVALAFRIPLRIQHLPQRCEAVHAFSDHTRVRDIFSCPEPVDLRTGIAKMAEWVRKRGAVRPIEFKDIEVRKNLPSSWA